MDRRDDTFLIPPMYIQILYNLALKIINPVSNFTLDFNDLNDFVVRNVLIKEF